MPPKKKPQVSDKNKQKSRLKSADDKTFGLKNKNKSKKVQELIRQVTTGADGGLAKKKEEDAKKRAAEKKAAEEAKKEAAKLFGITQQKVPFGVDPKSILCEFFKAGLCDKGPKCKFSHDPNVGRKDAKKDLYTDAREETEEDKMENWDEEKLRSVITSKHGNLKTTTDIVCKHFIDAVENGKYGWFWICPNGGNECKYRHSLPEGFVLKTKEQKRLEKLAEDESPKMTLEEFIELERGKLDKSKFTPITAKTFVEWKTNINAKKAKREEQENKKRSLTGREIIKEKFSDKFYTEEDSGESWDLSAFKSALPEVDDENIKDYGDGSNVQEFYQNDESKVEETEVDEAKPNTNEVEGNKADETKIDDATQ